MEKEMTKEEYKAKWGYAPKKDVYAAIHTKEGANSTKNSFCVVSCFDEALDFIELLKNNYCGEEYHLYKWLGPNPKENE
jgi:hypothetical protein